MFIFDQEMEQLVFDEEELQHLQASPICILQDKVDDNQVVNFHGVDRAEQKVEYALFIVLQEYIVVVCNLFAEHLTV